MKNANLFLITVLCCLTSCLKKQYASFQKDSPSEYKHSIKKSKQTVTQNIELSKTQAIDVALPSNPTESFLASSSDFTLIEKAELAEKVSLSTQSSINKKVTFKRKVSAFKQNSYLKKQATSLATSPKKADPDKLASASLICGLIGLPFLYIMPPLGLLLGLLALIFGISCIKKTKKRTMAKIGIILGILSTILLIISLFLVLSFALA